MVCVFFPTSTTCLLYLRSSTKEEVESWVEQGYYFLDEKQQAYRPTWKGAVIMGLRAVIPWKWLRAYASRRKEKRLIQEIGIVT